MQHTKKTLELNVLLKARTQREIHDEENRLYNQSFTE